MSDHAAIQLAYLYIVAWLWLLAAAVLWGMFMFELFSNKIDSVQATLDELPALIAAKTANSLTEDQKNTISNKLDALANAANVAKAQLS